MADKKFKAEKRDPNIKNVFRKSIREGFLPAVMYNRHTEKSFSVKLPRNEFTTFFQKARSNSIFEVEYESHTYKTYIKSFSESYGFHADLEHVDLFIIEPGEKIKISVPVRTTGVPKGVTLGGIMEVFCKTVAVECLAEDVPEEIVLDVSDLDIGEHISIKDLRDYKNVDVLDNDETIIISVFMKGKDSAVKQTDSEASEEETEPAEAS